MADPNLHLLRNAVSKLGDLANELVFVGGCTTGLFITDEGADNIRSTKDVDAIVETATYSQYVDFEKRLEQRGFIRDLSPGAPICRWMIGDTILDVMPIEEGILGFKNRWYQDAVSYANRRQIDGSITIRVVSPPYFVATKLEAFADRGSNDFLGSRDLEDIITVVNGREEISSEIASSPDDLRTYIGDQVRRLLSNHRFVDALPGHLNPDVGRVMLVIERFESMASISAS